MPIQAQLDQGLSADGQISFHVEGYQISTRLTPDQGVAPYFRVTTVARVRSAQPLPQLRFDQAGANPSGQLSLRGNQRTYVFPSIELIGAQTVVDRREKFLVLDFVYDAQTILNATFPGSLENESEAALEPGALPSQYTYGIDGENPEHLLGAMTHRTSASAVTVQFTSLRNRWNSFLKKAVEIHDDIAGNANAVMPTFEVSLGGDRIEVTPNNLTRMDVSETFGVLHAKALPGFVELVGEPPLERPGDRGVPRQSHRELLNHNEVVQPNQAMDGDGPTVESASFAFLPGNYLNLVLS